MTMRSRIKGTFAVEAYHGGSACHSQRLRQANQVFHRASHLRRSTKEKIGDLKGYATALIMPVILEI
jgi:hypothetical protein